MRTSRSLILAFFLITLGAFSQTNGNFWQVGVGYNFVDDSGPGLNDYFNFKEIWHAVPYPSRLTIGYYTQSGFGYEVIGTYNEYDAGKIVDGGVLPFDQTYVAVDGKLSYDLNKLVGQTGWFDPYLMTGAGYTWIGAVDRATFNAGGGFNLWFTENFGFNLNSMGKWGLFTDRGTNHVQHSLGLIFKFGKEDEPFIEEIPDTLPTPTENEVVEEESQVEVHKVPTQDTIVPPPPVAPQKSEAELRREQMLTDLKVLPKVYFAFNSSYLTPDDKAIVDQLVAFMKEYAEATIEVQAHADARGTDKYNTWLAERRANRIVDYVIAKGIAANRISGKGFGENKILNHCTNDVTCSEQEHRENRRTNYELN
ncbi:OmpA family protein [Robertkochia marina]|uniref:OmpA family protein n=1 Tax=Robertkochia marina TaxID=1227945 RepID=A0A4S3LYV1_9FLAO|nr:OmpA family protein [Robertkochia marina]THD66762.1 OmpA family protein [Robertkochia marina]TRZ42349.1 OmpA family protein [Robertkochia marina]